MYLFTAQHTFRLTVVAHYHSTWMLHVNLRQRRCRGTLYHGLQPRATGLWSRHGGASIPCPNQVPLHDFYHYDYYLHLLFIIICTSWLSPSKAWALAQQKLHADAPCRALQCGCECIRCTLRDGSVYTDTNVCNDPALEVSCEEENGDNCGPQFSGKDATPHAMVAVP